MKTPPCYCDRAPRDGATGQPRFRCNVCLNAILDEKNRLVREEQCLPERLAGEFERGRRYGVREEGARILARVEEARAAWGLDPSRPGDRLVAAALGLLASCITHRGVTRDEAVQAALARLAAEKAEVNPCTTDT